MIAGVVGRDTGIGVDTDLGIVRAGRVALTTVRDRATGMAIAVTAIIAMAIAAIMTDGGIRSQRSVLAQSLVVRLPLRHRHLRQSTVHRLTVTATRTFSGAIIVIGPIGRPTTLSSRITAHVSSVIRHTDSGNLLNSMKPPFMGGFVFVD